MKIGFSANEETKQEMTLEPTRPVSPQPRTSLVSVQFPGKPNRLTYLNNRFDLHPGDMVYVSGKLEGICGRICDVSYNFKVKPSDYEWVIHLVQRDVRGEFHIMGENFVTYDPNALPISKVAAWYMSPDDEEYLICHDESSFPLSDLQQMDILPHIAKRGHDYYVDGNVRYLCLDGTNGFAIVQNETPYAVEFTYKNGEIRELDCSCPCSYTCKHEFAVMLQLKELLEQIPEAQHSYFAAIGKADLFRFALLGKESGSFKLEI